MANLLHDIGKRILISKSRGSVRGSVIFLLTHLLLIIGMIFVVQVVVVLLGTADIYIPLAGRFIELLQQIMW
ncbi:MAG: hypothetical protein LBC70_02095 [Chitinispirillales bacterium]|jgi:hypothetical protein|nr:hypothetical protein [Chitinispirillales bacterium]